MRSRLPLVVVALLATALAVLCLLASLVWVAAVFAGTCLGLLWFAARLR